MLPTINILGLDYPMYMLMIILGIAIAILIANNYFRKFNDISKEDVFYSMIYALIGVIVGAKVLYIITIIPDLIKNFSQYNIMDLLKGGFVFYGGLIGGIVGLYIYVKQFKLQFKSLFLTLMPVVPLIHAFGRIGCFCAGCCYGCEYDGIGHIIFHNSEVAPNNIPLFPVQLVESGINIIIFIILLLTYKKYIGTYKTVALYTTLYGISRFSLEFFRGDYERGIFFGISTSQWISIVIILIGIILFINKSILKNIRRRKTNEK